MVRKIITEGKHKIAKKVFSIDIIKHVWYIKTCKISKKEWFI